MNSYGDGNTYRGTVCKDSETQTIITDGKTAYSGKDYPCPDEECQGSVTLENGYWQCDECSFRTIDTRGR